IIAPMPKGAAVVRRLNGDDIADRLVFHDPPHGFFHRWVIPPAETRHDGQVLFLRLLAGLDDDANAGRIDRDRRPDQRMLALLYRVRQMVRAEMGWSSEDDHIDTAVDHLLVSIESDEHMIRRDLHAILNSIHTAQLAQARLSKVDKRIAHSYKHVLGTRI